MSDNGVLYEKRGRYYYPISDLNALEGLSKGAWLVIVEPGCRSIRSLIDPDFAAVDAALKLFGDDLLTYLSEASRSMPPKRPLTAKERKAYQAYCDVMGEEAMVTFERPALADVVAKVIARLRVRMRRWMQDE